MNLGSHARVSRASPARGRSYSEPPPLSSQSPHDAWSPVLWQPYSGPRPRPDPSSFWPPPPSPGPSSLSIGLFSGVLDSRPHRVGPGRRLLPQPGACRAFPEGWALGAGHLVVCTKIETRAERSGEGEMRRRRAYTTSTALRALKLTLAVRFLAAPAEYTWTPRGSGRPPRGRETSLIGAWRADHS